MSFFEVRNVAMVVVYGKKSVIRKLWKREEEVCSTADAVKLEKRYLTRVFRDNGYPCRTIRKWTKSQHTHTHEDRPHTNRRITLPYIKGASEVAARVLKDNGVQVAHKPCNTLHGVLTRVKDKEEPLQQAGVVYRIGCNDCNAEYVGETQKKLASRVEEHQRAVRRRDPGAALFKHTTEHQHTINWEGAKVLYKDNSKKRRLFLEAWATKDNCINRSVDLNPIYLGVRNNAT